MILFRYVLKEALTTILVCLVGVVGIYLVIDYADRAKQYTGAGAGLAVAQLYGCKALLLLYQLAPAALLLGAGACMSSLRQRGEVTAIGGLKEKLLAAHRGGIKTVMIPEENAKDLVEISDNIKGGLEIIPVSRMDEVLKHALVRVPEPIQWDEAAQPVKSPDGVVEEDASGLTAH